MAWNQSEHQRRRDKVLGIVVNKYIQTVSPISSGYIAQEYMPDLSSASIRNILAELEKEGFLMHPHTSAGRVPTQEGYRYFVDNLMNEINLLEQEKEKIKNEYVQGVKDLEIVLDRTSKVISDVTHYTSIISIDGCYDRLFCRGINYVVQYPDCNDINKIKNILQSLEHKENLLGIINREISERIKIYIGHEIAWADFEECSLAISSYRIGDKASGRLAVLGPKHMDYQRVVSTLEYCSELMNQSIF